MRRLRPWSPAPGRGSDGPGSGRQFGHGRTERPEVVDHGLIDQHVAVGQEQDALLAPGLPQPPDDLKGGVGLAGPGRHHQQDALPPLGDSLDRGVDRVDLIVARLLAAGVVEIVVQDDRLALGRQPLPGAIALPEAGGRGKGVAGQDGFARGAGPGAVVEHEAGAVGREHERHVQGLGVVERLLHAVAGGVGAVLGLDHGEREVGLVVEDVVGPLPLAAADQPAAHGDAPLGKAHLPADLRALVPPGPAQGRRDQRRADVTLGKMILLLVHSAGGGPGSEPPARRPAPGRRLRLAFPACAGSVYYLCASTVRQAIGVTDVQHHDRLTPQRSCRHRCTARRRRRHGLHASDLFMSTSPASTGPAGAHFEGQVGAHYLLSMLIDSDPRGLPGVAIDRIEFQRRAEGHPLDDIVVHAHDNQGCATLLEIQVKRSVTFAPSDRVFREVVGQVAEASRRPAFRTTNHQLAVAISRGSQKVAGPYQDVLTWARRVDSAQTFMGRLFRSGAANKPMRTFVDTFRENLRAAQAQHDDATVHHLLSRFQILQFDYGAPGSLSEAWDNERSSQALDDGDRPRARDFHRRLVELAIETEAAGGDLTRDRLIERLREGSFRLAGRRGYRDARRSLAEASRHALDDIEDRVGGVTLIRAERMSAVHAVLDQGRYVEIRGDAGVGKSALLKHFAEQLSAEAPIIVLSPGRTPAGGWTQMRAVLGLEGTAHDLLIDMTGAGSTTIFLDGLDFFSQEERTTIRDLVREAAKIRGIALIVTARSDFGRGDEPNWLPDEALATLRHADVHINELNEIEVNEIVSAAPKLGPLLAESHPARNVARNLFRLSRLAAYPDNERPRTEIDLAERWWQTADGESDGRRDRSRLLLHLAKQAIAGIEPTDSRGYPSRAVDALVESQTLRDLGGERMMFRHDIYRDWAIANVLYSRPDTRRQLELNRAVPAALVRSVELTARMSLERCVDDSDWQALLEEVSRDEAHHSWRRAVLLAPVRSEISINLLKRVSNHLLADEARVLRELIKAVMAVDAVPARELAAPGVDPNIIPKDLYYPGAPSWWRLIEWLLSVDPQLPSVMIPEVAARMVLRLVPPRPGSDHAEVGVVVLPPPDRDRRRSLSGSYSAAAGTLWRYLG